MNKYISSYALCYIVTFAKCEGNIGWEENIEMKNVRSILKENLKQI